MTLCEASNPAEVERDNGQGDVAVDKPIDPIVALLQLNTQYMQFVRAVPGLRNARNVHVGRLHQRHQRSKANTANNEARRVPPSTTSERNRLRDHGNDKAGRRRRSTCISPPRLLVHMLAKPFSAGLTSPRARIFHCADPIGHCKRRTAVQGEPRHTEGLQWHANDASA